MFNVSVSFKDTDSTIYIPFLKLKFCYLLYLSLFPSRALVVDILKDNSLYRLMNKINLNKKMMPSKVSSN